LKTVCKYQEDREELAGKLGITYDESEFSKPQGRKFGGPTINRPFEKHSASGYHA